MNPDLAYVCASGLNQEHDSPATTKPSRRAVSIRKPFAAEELLQSLHTILTIT
jgi:hypothetical protein